MDAPYGYFTALLVQSLNRAAVLGVMVYWHIWIRIHYNCTIIWNCEFCFRILALSSHSVIPSVRGQAWHPTLSPLYDLLDYKNLIFSESFWPDRPDQTRLLFHHLFITSSSLFHQFFIISSPVIHQLSISSSSVATDNDNVVQNLIQFLVQNSHSLLLSSSGNEFHKMKI